MVQVKLHPLDNCQLFVQLRNLFQTYDDQTKRLATFLYWGGNEEHVDELCARVVRLLVEHELVAQEPNPEQPDELKTVPTGPEAITHLRGVFIYLVVNTAATSDCKTPWSLQCQHLCQQLPLLPQFLTMDIAMRCGLQQVLLEFLECGPGWVTIQYFATLTEAIAHIDSVDATLGWISNALKHAGRAYHNYGDKEMLVCEMGRMLQRYMLDSAERLNNLRPKARKVYLAKAMVVLLEVIIEVLHYDPNDAPVKPAYFNTYKDLSPHMGQQPDAFTKNDPIPYVKVLLDSLQRIVEEVSVAVFMHWVEVPSPWILYNYQTLICHHSAEVLNAVQPYTELHSHTVCSQIQSFSQSAQTFKEIVASATIGELLCILDGKDFTGTKEQFLEILDCLLNKQIALGNDECVETIAKHVKLLNLSHATIILNYLREVSEARKASVLDIKVEKMDTSEQNDNWRDEEEEENEEEEEEEYAKLLRLLLLPIFTQCCIKDKVRLLELRDELGITKEFCYKGRNHNQRRISFFNRLMRYCPDVENKLMVFLFENPDESWLSLATLAITHPRFTNFFWRIARICIGHSIRQMADIASILLLDNELLLKSNSGLFLLSIYMYPLVLNGQIRLQDGSFLVSLYDDGMPYGMGELRTAQADFLEAVADSLNFYTAKLNYIMLRRILRLLGHMMAVERQVQDGSRRQLLRIKRHPDATAVDVSRAKHYLSLHRQLPKWRNINILLTKQLMFTVDALRWNLTNFDLNRVHVLGLAVKYWKLNMSELVFLNNEFSKEVFEITAHVKHQEFLSKELAPGILSIRRTFVLWLTKATAAEATVLFLKSINTNSDCVSFLDVGKAVEQANCTSARKALVFLFGCYVDACIKYVHGQKTLSKKKDWKQQLGMNLNSVISTVNSNNAYPELNQKLELFKAKTATIPTEPTESR